MTKLEKKQLLEAAELIATDKEEYSCTALYMVWDLNKCDLSCKYKDFFAHDSSRVFWLHSLLGYDIPPNIKDLRILMLLMFREAGD